MDTYDKNVSIVITCMKNRQYPNEAILKYMKTYDSIKLYLRQQNMEYSSGLGESWIENENCAPFNSHRDYKIQYSSIAKLNDVYEFGHVTIKHLTIGKQTRNILISGIYNEYLEQFEEKCKASYEGEQLCVTHRRCTYFIRFLQSRGCIEPQKIDYSDLLFYHQSLSYLKNVSRQLEETSVKQFLYFLSGLGAVKYGAPLYMEALQLGVTGFITPFTNIERTRLNDGCDEISSLFPNEYLTVCNKIKIKHQELGYCRDVIQSLSKAIDRLFLFLDFNDLRYAPQIGIAWLNSKNTKQSISMLAWKTSRRLLFMINDALKSEDIELRRKYTYRISGIDRLPVWCTDPIKRFAELLTKEKLEDNTVDNYIYSIVRFCNYLIQNGISSFSEITGRTLLDFNLHDRHMSSEGKNHCNNRICRFLKYLEQNEMITAQGIYQILNASGASAEKNVIVLNSDEVHEAKEYILKANNSFTIRDSAILLLGTDMGIRGCDIVNIRLQDIDWNKRNIRFFQDKTEVEVCLPMPVSVGNAIFKYLKEARPRRSSSDHLFINHKAPYGPLTRHACWKALKSALPERSVYGSGFHVTRKTFSTNSLRNGIKPDMIANALGHTDSKSLQVYLSLDDDRMVLCPLSLSNLGILPEGGQ